MQGGGKKLNSPPETRRKRVDRTGQIRFARREGLTEWMQPSRNQLWGNDGKQKTIAIEIKRDFGLRDVVKDYQEASLISDHALGALWESLF